MSDHYKIDVVDGIRCIHKFIDGCWKTVSFDYVVTDLNKYIDRNQPLVNSNKDLASTCLRLRDRLTGFISRTQSLLSYCNDWDDVETDKDAVINVKPTSSDKDLLDTRDDHIARLEQRNAEQSAVIDRMTKKIVSRDGVVEKQAKELDSQSKEIDTLHGFLCKIHDISTEVC